MKNLKKGAMFGLDARIALAIFGALSVISGAALYSAIANAKMTARITNFTEIEKAVEQYYLDTSLLPPVSTTNSVNDLSAYALVEKPSGVTGWNGPYLPNEKYVSGDALVIDNNRFSLMYRESDNASSICTKSSANCSVFIWHGESDHNFAKSINEFIDNEDSSAATNYTGKIHYYATYHTYKTNIPFEPTNSPNT